MKYMRYFLLTVILGAAPCSAQMFTVHSSALRMEDPFFLESGKEESDFYVQVDRNIDKPGNGTILMRTDGLPSDVPLYVWVRVWWEGTGRSIFSIRAGDDKGVVCSGTGFSDSWTWVRASGTLTFGENQHTCTVEYRKGGFCIDRIFFTREDSTSPEDVTFSSEKESASIYFYDDFMREKKGDRQNLGSWHVSSGIWSQYMISNVGKGRKSSEPSKSANAFALKGENTGNEDALILNGDTRWRNYRISGSICIEEQGSAGLVFNYQDDGNYYVFSVGAGERGSTRLIKKLKGKTHILAEFENNIEPGNYYSFSAQAVDGNITCAVDDTHIFNIKDSGILCGRIGLLASAGGSFIFDDILATGSRVIKEDFENWDYGIWKKISGEWYIKWPKGSAGLFASLGHEIPSGRQTKSAKLVGRGDKESLIVIGNPEWNEYYGSAVTGVLHPGNLAGLIFNYKDEEHYRLFTGSVSLKKRTGRKNITLTVSSIEEGRHKEVESVVTAYDPRASRFGIRAEQGKAHFFYNGRKVLQVADAGISGGMFGLTAVSGDGIEFDDVAIDFAARKEPSSWHFVVPIFTEEGTMKNWARESSDWVKGGNNIVRNIKDFYGDIGVELTVKRINAPHTIMIKNSVQDEDGYRLDITLAGGDKFKAEISRRGEPAASAEFILNAGSEKSEEGIPVLLEKDGHYISAKVNNRIVAEFRDAQPLNRGRRVAVKVPGSFSFEHVKVKSANLKNYLFTLSPVDWYTRGGSWKITNRWKCDPRWSWYGGRGKRKAVLWNKRELRGDFTIDLFMSMQMDQRGRPHYYHPGDMNITVCADGENLGSGYSFLFGGHRGTVTQILKNNEPVAETRERLFLPPSTRDHWHPATGPSGLHRRWFHLTVVKRSGLFEYYLDNQLMCSFRDPDPLPGRRFGIWTYENGIMVARVRVTAEGISDRKTYFAPADISDRETASAPEKQPHLTFTSTTHPLGMENTGSRADWIIARNRKEAGRKPYVAVVKKCAFKGRRSCLKAANPQSGGRFSLKLFEGNRKVESFQRLYFDYLLPSKRVKQDLFFKTDRGWYYVRFSGDSAPVFPGKPPFYPLKIGDLNAQADGKWHSVSLDIYNLFKYYLGTKDFSDTVIKAVFFGYARYGYTDAGIGGNFKGDCYYLDRIRFGGGQKDIFRASWKSGDTGYTGYAFAFDSVPDTVPDKKTAVKAYSVEEENLPGGTHYFHVRGVRDGGGVSPVIHYRVDVDKEPPSAERIGFTKRGALIYLADRGSGIDWETLNILIGKKRMKWGGPGLTVMPAQHALNIDYAHAGIVLDEGDIHVSVISVRDRAGNILRKSFYRKKKYTYGDDTVPPDVAFMLSPSMRKQKYGFEKESDLWHSQVGDKAVALLDRNIAYRGTSSMALFHTDHASRFKFHCPLRINLAETPYITFMYRLMPDVRVNLAFDSAVGNLNIGFSDRNTNSRTIGKILNVKQDSTWGKAHVNLRDALLSHSSSIKSLDITGFYFEDIEWQAADPMTRFWIDDFFLHSVYDNSEGKRKIWIRIADASGIKRLSYRFSLLSSPSGTGTWKALDEPKPDSTGFYPIRIPAHLEGERRVEVFAADRAGNKSPVRTFPLILDNSSPRIASVRPFPGAQTAVSRMTLELRDDYSGIKHKSILLNVNGREYRAGSPLLSYSSRDHILTFDISRQAGSNVFPDNTKIKAGLYAEDGAGHPIKHMWNWTMDYSKDTTPPPVPYVTVLPCMKGLETFETSAGEWLSRGGSRGAEVRITDEDSALGRKCLKITNRSGSGYHSCYVRRRPFNGLADDYVSFDYKIPEDVHVDFTLLVNGQWYAIQFASPRNRYKRIGQVKCIQDGKWHHTEFNLGEMLKSKFPNSSGRVLVRNMLMGEWDSKHRNKKGAAFYIDNFALFPSTERRQFRFGWKNVYDATGIKGFTYTFSKNAKDTPDTECGRKTMMEFPDPEPGSWYFHLSAQDNNGNTSTPGVIGPLHAK